MPTIIVLEKQNQVTKNIISRKYATPLKICYKYTKTTILIATHMKKQQLLQRQIWKKNIFLCYSWVVYGTQSQRILYSGLNFLKAYFRTIILKNIFPRKQSESTHLNSLFL